MPLTAGLQLLGPPVPLLHSSLPPSAIPLFPTRRAVLKGKQTKRKEFVTPTETNAHGDALYFVVMGPSLLQIGGWWLVAVGGWQLAVGDGWQLLAVGGPWGAVRKGYP